LARIAEGWRIAVLHCWTATHRVIHSAACSRVAAADNLTGCKVPVAASASAANGCTWPTFATIGVFSFVYFALLNTAIPWLIFVAIVLSFIPHDMAYGPQAALIAECFPARLRYRAPRTAFIWHRSSPAGPAPLIATALLAWTGSGYAIALYILLTAASSVAATIPLPDYTNRDISEERAYGSVPVANAVPVEASPDGWADYPVGKPASKPRAASFAASR
jgi:hypothetical protein